MGGALGGISWGEPCQPAEAAQVLVTVLWSSSYILNQWAFAEGIRSLTLAGLRYCLAVLCMLALGLALEPWPAFSWKLAALAGPDQWGAGLLALDPLPAGAAGLRVDHAQQYDDARQVAALVLTGLGILTVQSAKRRVPD